MKKTLAVLAIAGLVLIVMVATVFAYSTATGCVVDGKNGDPWTHGGDVTVEYPAGSGHFIGYTTTLDATGCFDASLWPSGVHEAGTLHIDPTAGSQGDPDEILCEIPADNTATEFECGTMFTTTGPNAVTWTVVSASTSPGFPLEMAAYGLLALIFVGGGVALWRQQRLNS